MQLSVLNLQGNSLVGTLPQSWSNLTNVGHCHRGLENRTVCTCCLKLLLHVACNLAEAEHLPICQVSKAPSWIALNAELIES